MNLKKKNFGNVFTSKFVGAGPSSYEKRIYRAAVPQRLRNTDLKDTFGYCDGIFHSYMVQQTSNIQ
jgi:hypothetical protein